MENAIGNFKENHLKNEKFSSLVIEENKFLLADIEKKEKEIHELKQVDK